MNDEFPKSFSKNFPENLINLVNTMHICNEIMKKLNKYVPYESKFIPDILEVTSHEELMKINPMDYRDLQDYFNAEKKFGMNDLDFKYFKDSLEDDFSKKKLENMDSLEIILYGNLKKIEKIIHAFNDARNHPKRF